MHLSRIVAFAVAVVTIASVGFSALALPSAKMVAVSGPTDGVLRATLSNGLRVVVVRNSLAPVVARAVNYLVGSDEAPDEYPGMAHAQEHMMFRGSPGLSSDQLANIGSLLGGTFNANTREGLTQYLYTVPSEDLDIALHIEALRMKNVLDTQEDWDKERGAIEQEVAQDHSRPFDILYEKLRMQLFKGTPYAHDALGTGPSFDKTSAAALKEFHDRWYAPNNAILVIVGNVDPQAALAEVVRLFGAIPRKKLPKRPKMVFEPVVPDTLSVDTDRPNAAQIVAIRMPGLDSPDYPALEVLSDVLASKRFALYNLVVQGKAVATDFSLDSLPKASIGYAIVSFPAGGNSQTLDAAIRTVFSKVVNDGVPPDLIEAAKLRERRQTEFQKNSIANLASDWSDAIALYGLASPEADLARIEKVSVADVNRVARKYLDTGHTISGTMLPRSSGKPVSAGVGFGGQETISLGEPKSTLLPSWAQKELSRLVVPASTVHPVVSKLANGLTLIVQPESVSDTITIYGHIRNRPETEEARGKEGESLVLDQLLSYGTEHLNRVDFQKALDEIGANESAGTDFGIELLAEDFDRGVGLLADNELHPALPQSAFDVLRNQMAETVAARNQSPGYLAQRSLRASLYLLSDPSLREALPSSVLNLSRDDVKSYYKRVFRPDLTTIIVIGNITPNQARAEIERYFGGWSADGPLPETDLPLAPPNSPNTISVPDGSRIQDGVTLAQNLALTRSDPDYYPLELGNTVLGGGFYATRLSVDLRKNAGLVYSVSAGLQSGRTRSAYVIRYASDPENVSKAANMVAKEIAKMQTVPVATEELARAKAILLREIPLNESSIDEIARGLADRADLNLPIDEPSVAARLYINLTPSDVQMAFQKWMRPNDLVRVSQGPTPY